jgi:hypothetical protein
VALGHLRFVFRSTATGCEAVTAYLPMVGEAAGVVALAVPGPVVVMGEVAGPVAVPDTGSVTVRVFVGVIVCAGATVIGKGDGVGGAFGGVTNQVFKGSIVVFATTYTLGFSGCLT